MIYTGFIIYTVNKLEQHVPLPPYPSFFLLFFVSLACSALFFSDSHSTFRDRTFFFTLLWGFFTPNRLNYTFDTCFLHVFALWTCLDFLSDTTTPYSPHPHPVLLHCHHSIFLYFDLTIPLPLFITSLYTFCSKSLYQVCEGWVFSL